MSPDKNRPRWDSNAKDKSLELCAAWLNQIAREAFLVEGHHQQMFHFVTDAGDIQSCLFRDGLPLSERDEVLKQEKEKIKPFGTIQVIIRKIIHPKLTTHPKAWELRFAGDEESDTKEMVRDCLLVRMLSRTGKEIVWASPIISKDGRLVLAASVMSFPNDGSLFQ